MGTGTFDWATELASLRAIEANCSGHANGHKHSYGDRLEAVVESPILRADGTVLQAPGYDPLTGIVFRPQVSFPRVPEHPTKADVTRASWFALGSGRRFSICNGGSQECLAGGNADAVSRDYS